MVSVAEMEFVVHTSVMLVTVSYGSMICVCVYRSVPVFVTVWFGVAP